MSSSAPPNVKSYFDAIKFQISSQLIRWAIFIVRWGAGSLKYLDEKIDQRPASLDLYILQDMLGIVENLPRFRIPNNLQSELHIRPGVPHFASVSIIEKRQVYLRRIICLPVRGALRTVFRVLRSLYWLDRKLHRRNPRILTTLKRILITAENTERLVGELKCANELRLLPSQISQGKSSAVI